jgi:uncharacterized integral membrane protein
MVIAGMQNNVPLVFKFISWEFQISLTALFLYASMLGAAVIAVLSLPKLTAKYFKIRELNKEINDLRKKIDSLGKKYEEEHSV